MTQPSITPGELLWVEDPHNPPTVGNDAKGFAFRVNAAQALPRLSPEHVQWFGVHGAELSPDQTRVVRHRYMAILATCPRVQRPDSGVLAVQAPSRRPGPQPTAAGRLARILRTL